MGAWEGDAGPAGFRTSMSVRVSVSQPTNVRPKRRLDGSLVAG